MPQETVAHSQTAAVWSLSSPLFRLAQLNCCSCNTPLVVFRRTDVDTLEADQQTLEQVGIAIMQNVMLNTSNSAQCSPAEELSLTLLSQLQAPHHSLKAFPAEEEEHCKLPPTNCSDS